MEEQGLWRLRVVMAAMDTSTVRSADNERCGILVARAVSHFGQFIGDLVEGWKDVIGKLNLANWLKPFLGDPDAKANDALLGERRIKAARFAILFLQACCHPKDASKGARIFAKD